MSDEQVPEPTDMDLAAWGSTTSHEEFGRLTAEWLLGRRSYHPAYAASGPDSETTPALEQLAAINRLGFVTDGSQPGMPRNPSGSAQRAYVTGYCTEAVANRIRAALLYTDLVVITFAPFNIGDGSIVVSVDEGNEHTWLGRTGEPGDDVDLYAERGGPALGDLVGSSWELQAFDPQWGRNDRLLPSVLAALRGSP